MNKLTRREALRLAGVGSCAAAAGAAAGWLLPRPSPGQEMRSADSTATSIKRTQPSPNAKPPKVTPAATAAMEMFNEGKGFNCAQAVLSCCGKAYGLSRETGCRMGSAFVGGMGLMGLTCGSVTGAFMVIGLKYAQLDANDSRPAGEANRVVREFARRFTQLHGSICCNELLGHDISTPEGLQAIVGDSSFAKKCPLYVRDAAAMVEELLADGKPTT